MLICEIFEMLPVVTLESGPVKQKPKNINNKIVTWT